MICALLARQSASGEPGECRYVVDFNRRSDIDRIHVQISLIWLSMSVSGLQLEAVHWNQKQSRDFQQAESYLVFPNRVRAR